MAGLTPDLPKVEQHIVEMTNKVRQQQNLSTLKINALLTKAARAYAAHLARTGQFSHSADGRNPGQRAERAGYQSCTVAENLAMNRSQRGFDSGELALQTVAGWMNSAPHRANILLSSATEIGVGVARSADAAPKFISVELFARPASDGVKFEVFNASGANVTYAFQGRTRDLKPRTTLTQSSCAPGDITFSQSAGLLSASSEIARIRAENGKRYTLNSDASGTVSVDVGGAGKR